MAVIRVRDVLGGRTQTDGLMGAVHYSVSEEVSTLVGDRTGLTAEAEVGRRRKKTIDWEDGEEINIHEDRTSSAHSESMPQCSQ